MWVKQREIARKNKEIGAEKPWTSDPIVQGYRFCNVHREDDAVTKWIAGNVRPLQYEDDFPHFSVMARQLNLPSSIHAILQPKWPYSKDQFDYVQVRKVLREIKERGGQVFNAAYIVSTNGVAQDKIDYLAERWVEHYHIMQEWDWDEIDTLKKAFLRLRTLNGIASFMAGQIVADLKHTSWLEYAPDWWDWCSPGPGSMRGLNRIMGFSLGKKYQPQEFIDYLLKLRDEAHLPRMCLQDLQNCLCETDKYLRKLQDGRNPKQKYPGR